MNKTLNLVVITAGAFGVGTLAILVTEHIDKTEDSKGMRIFKKVGVYALALVAGGLLADITMSGNLSRDMYNGNMKFKLTEGEA